METEKKLKQFLELMHDSLSKTEFLASFKALIQQLLELEKKLIEKINSLISSAESSLTTFKDKLETRVNSELSKALKKIDDRDSRITKQQEDGLNFIKDKVRNLKNGIDGKDADEKLIVAEVLKQIPKPIEETPEQLADKLAGILEIKDIQDLRKELDEIRKLKTQHFGGGGFSTLALNFHILDPYTPTGLINGVNTDFVLSHTPSPATSLIVWKDGQKMKLTTDYTLSNLTITFLTAPLTDSIIEASHRI